MERAYVTAFLEDDSPEMEEIRGLFATIPVHEPANGGPDDDGFLGAMQSAINTDSRGAFPSPYFTSKQQYSVKK